MSNVRDIGLIDYRFSDIEMNLQPFMRAETFEKLEVRTTFDFYNDVYVSFNTGKCDNITLFSDKLYKENKMFMLESIYSIISSDFDIPIFVFVFNYKLTNTLLKRITTEGSRYCDSLVAKLVNDMCKVKIENVLEGN